MILTRLVLVLAIVAFFALGVYTIFNPDSGGTVQGTNPGQISMIDPSGRNPESDFQNSQTNLNNSGANLNNSEAGVNLAVATAIIEQSAAQAEKTRAEACNIRNDCNASNPADSLRAVASGATIVLVGIVAGFFLLILVVVAKQVF